MKKVLLFFSFMSVFELAQPCSYSKKEDLAEIDNWLLYPASTSVQRSDSSSSKVIVSSSRPIDYADVGNKRFFTPTHVNLKGKGLFSFWNESFSSDVASFCKRLKKQEGMSKSQFNVTVDLKKKGNDLLSSSQFTDDHLKLFLKELSLCPCVVVLDISQCLSVTLDGFSEIKRWSELKTLKLPFGYQLNEKIVLNSEKFPQLTSTIYSAGSCGSEAVAETYNTAAADTAKESESDSEDINEALKKMDEEKRTTAEDDDSSESDSEDINAVLNDEMNSEEKKRTTAEDDEVVVEADNAAAAVEAEDTEEWIKIDSNGEEENERL